MTEIADAIYHYHAERVAAEPARGYVGCSSLGDPCARALWYSFHWADKPEIPGRLARLFLTGHREEDRLLDELREIGCTVWDRDDNGNQFSVQACDGHLKGHADAVVENLPGAPEGMPVLVDIKTSSKKKFDELLNSNLPTLYPRYYAQAQLYMGLMGLEVACYIFHCKDDDRLHAEWMQFEQVTFDELIAKAQMIIDARKPPPRLSEDSSYYLCGWCDFYRVCHDRKIAQANCRTCCHAAPVTGGQWHCTKHHDNIPVDFQRQGCGGHLFIPELVPATPFDGGDDFITYQREDGTTFTNGPDELAMSASFTSAELVEEMSENPVEVVA